MNFTQIIKTLIHIFHPLIHLVSITHRNCTLHIIKKKTFDLFSSSSTPFKFCDCYRMAHSNIAQQNQAHHFALCSIVAF